MALPMDSFPVYAGSSELEVAVKPELGALLASKLVERGDRVDLGFVSDVLARLRLGDRRKEKRDPVDDKELRLVDGDDRSLALFVWLRFLSFLARRSPTSSRLGSVQMTSNMVGRVAVGQFFP